MAKTDEFGYDAGNKFKDPAKRFKGKITVMDEPLEADFVAKDYPDCRVKKSHRGDLEIDCYVPMRGYSERWNWNGNHTIDYEEGSQAIGVTGTRVEKFKQGRNKTTQYAEQDATHNHRRVVTGNLDTQNELKTKGGGYYHEIAGHHVRLAATYTEGTTMASGKGEYHVGKKTINAEGGIGLGVNKGASRKVYLRMEPDGTFHVQVTPAGEEGGNAVIKINPDGTILVTSKTTITVKADQSITMDTKTLHINADVKLRGNLHQDGVHTDDNGVHTHCPC